MWNPYIADGCKTDWWESLLFTNVWTDNQGCIGWGWYISNDFVMFLCSLVCICAYSHKKIFGYALIGALIIAGLSADFYRAFHVKSMVTISLFDIDNTFYMKPYYRSTPYFIGLVVGIFYRNYTKAVKTDNTESRNIFYRISQANSTTKNIIFVICYCLGFFLILFIDLGPMDLLKNGRD